MGLSVIVTFPGETLVFMVLKISMLNCFRLQCHGFVRECCVSWSNSCFYGSKNIHVKLF